MLKKFYNLKSINCIYFLNKFIEKLKTNLALNFYKTLCANLRDINEK